MSLIRTFIAVEIAAEVRSRTANLIEKLRASQVKATWTKPPNLHLTLKFLGDTPDTRIPDVCRAIDAAATQSGPFRLQICGAGAFPRIASPRTVWIGAGEGAEEMIALQRAVDRQLHEIGFPRDRRRFKPHLTIGRVRGGGAEQQDLGRLIPEYADFDAGVTKVEELVAFASFLDKTGATYQVMGRARLTGSAASDPTE